MSNIETHKIKLEETIKKIADFLDLECNIEFRTGEDNTLFVSVYTPEDAKLLIGKNGQTLKALEHVVRAILSKNNEPVSLLLDVNDYRKSRASYLIDLAKQAVNRVRSTQKAEALMPMTAYERRVVHMELAAHLDIATESICEEPHRRVVVKPLNL